MNEQITMIRVPFQYVCAGCKEPGEKGTAGAHVPGHGMFHPTCVGVREEDGPHIEFTDEVQARVDEWKVKRKADPVLTPGEDALMTVLEQRVPEGTVMTGPSGAGKSAFLQGTDFLDAERAWVHLTDIHGGANHAYLLLDDWDEEETRAKLEKVLRQVQDLSADAKRLLRGALDSGTRK